MKFSIPKKFLHRFVKYTVLGALYAGCIPVNYYTADSRRNVREETSQLIIPGQTTREEVFLTLGEPDEFSPGGRRVVYSWTKVKALAYTTTSIQKSDLILTFDERGVVVHREVKQNFWVPW